MSENSDELIESNEFFNSQNTDAKLTTDIDGIVRMISLKVRRHNLDYDSLRYIFRLVRARCDIAVPRQSKRLLELPTQEDMDRFYGVIKNPFHQLIFETLAGTGLRIAELASLEVARIDFHSNQIFVSQGKGKKDRICVFGNRLKEKLRLYLEGRSNRFLFESNRHWKFSTRRLEQFCEMYKAKAHIHKTLTCHTFRHIWNSRLASGNLPKEKRKILAGHSSDKSQDIYTHLTLSGIKDEAISILDAASL